MMIVMRPKKKKKKKKRGVMQTEDLTDLWFEPGQGGTCYDSQGKVPTGLEGNPSSMARL